MKVLSKWGCLVCGPIVAILTSPAHAAPAATSSGSATVSVIQPISVVSEQDLDFGELADGSRNSVRIAPDAAAVAGDRHAGRFRVTGGTGMNYRIIPQSRIIASGIRHRVSVPVENVSVRSQNTGSLDGRGTLDQNGIDTVFVGGTLRLTPEMPADRYVATILVEVVYD